MGGTHANVLVSTAKGNCSRQINVAMHFHDVLLFSFPTSVSSFISLGIYTFQDGPPLSYKGSFVSKPSSLNHTLVENM